MRDWSKFARAASFRGVRFYVDSDGPERGRRIVVHEISGGEAALTEDMGKRWPRFSIDAYIASDLADIEGNLLERACETPGAALLTLPFDLPVMVHCESCSRQRERDRMGYYGYRLDFVLKGEGATAQPSPIGALRSRFASGASSAAKTMAALF